MKTKPILKVFLLFIFLHSTIAKAEDLDVQMNPSLYAGGYNISCYGANTGSINLFISGGVAPFTYVWNDGNTSRNRANLVAGIYQVTVTSANGASAVREITLTQPELFQAVLLPSQREGGYNISENGGNDGYIESQIQGGVPPYTYLWSNGSTVENADGLSVGTYSLTVHDATNCTATASVTLIEPTVLHVVSISSPVLAGGYNVSCRGENGSINLVVAGGAPIPSDDGTTHYDYQWNTGAFSQNLSNLNEGDYEVIIRDGNGVEISASISLTTSPYPAANSTAFTYPNGKNTSCYTCNNGSITLSNLIGVAPFTYNWNSGQTTQNITNVAAGSYSVTITDALGCVAVRDINLSSPEREVWTLSGNVGISTTQFIGTADNTSLPFKVNNSEVFKLVPDPTLNGPNSYAKFSKLISAESGITLDASRSVKISYESNASGNSVYYGDNKSFAPSCAVPTFTGIKHVFPGSIAAWTPVAGSNTLKAGIVIGAEPWNGTGTIELQGTNELGAETNPLNINWYCGKDIGLCTNPLKPGKVSTGRLFEVGFPSTQSGVNIAANIKGNEQIGLRVETVSEGVNTPMFNTRLVSDNPLTSILSGKIENTITGVDKELFSIKGDGETKIGNPSQPSLYVAPSFDAGSNAYIPGNVRIASLGNINSQFNLIQADGNGELTKINAGTLLNSTHYWESNNQGIDVFHSTGNVGIGSSNISPLSLLDIRGVAPNNINTYLQVSQDAEKFLSYKRLTGTGIKDILSMNGDGEFRVGFGESNTPWESTFLITSSLYDEIYSPGNVGINNSDPNAQLQVGSGVGSISMGSFWSNGLNNTWTTNYIGFNAARQKDRNNVTGTWSFYSNPSNAGSVIAGDLEGDLLFITIPNSNNTQNVVPTKVLSDADLLKDPNTNKSNTKMIITNDGKVGIGNEINRSGFTNDYNLYVSKGIRTERVKVDIGASNGWADYVFDKGYSKMPLSELENYITKNKHLPDMPTECEVQEEGVDLLEMQIKLLKNLEELTLHMIDLKNENQELKEEIKKMKK